jgi:hypothetical protein
MELMPKLLHAASVADIYINTQSQLAQVFGASSMPRPRYLSVSASNVFLLTTAFSYAVWDHLVHLSLSLIVLGLPPLFTRLQRLKIHQPYKEYSIILAYIKSAPLLEVFVLENTSVWSLNFDPYPSLISHGPKIPVPRLRVQSITDVLPIITFLLQLLPDPSETLAVSVINGHRGHIPLHLDRAGNDRIIFDHVKRFWRLRSGQDIMPAGRLQLFSPATIRFGAQPTTRISAPSIFYETACIVAGPDPILDTIHTIELRLDDWDIGLQDDETEPELILALRSLDFLLNARRIEVIDAKLSSITKHFEVWLRARQNATHPLVTMHYEGERESEAEAWMMQLMWAESIESVTFSQDLSTK